MLVAIGLGATVIGVIYLWLAWNLGYWRKRGVPGLKGHLLTGSFPNVFFQKNNLVYEIDAAYK